MTTWFLVADAGGIANDYSGETPEDTDHSQVRAIRSGNSSAVNVCVSGDHSTRGETALEEM